MPPATINGQQCRIASRPCIEIEDVEQEDGTYISGRHHKLPIFIFGEMGTVGTSELIKQWFKKMPWSDSEPALKLATLTITVNGEDWTFEQCSIKPASGGVLLYYEGCKYG